MTRWIVPFMALAMLVLAGCAAKPEVTPRNVDALARAIAELGPGVDPEEARRAAEISYAHPLRLAEEWQVSGPALVHNGKVLNGLREKGLCNDWTDAMLTRLSAEKFETLALHWATSPPGDFRVIHHSAVISARGETRDDGLVLDPWRWGGTLFWSRTHADTRYRWGPPILAKTGRRAEAGRNMDDRPAARLDPSGQLP